MGADRNQWQFPKNEANKIPGWRSDGKGLENKIVPLIGLSLASEIRDFLDTAPYVDTRTELKALDTSKDTTAILTEDGREGIFNWKAGDYSSQIAADTAEGIYVKADEVAATAGAWVRYFWGRANAKWFGCVGNYDPDTRTGTNDTSAIQAAFATAPAFGLDLQFPDGVFYHLGELDYPSDLRVFGNSRLTSQIYIEIDNTMAGGRIEATNVHIEDIGHLIYLTAGLGADDGEYGSGWTLGRYFTNGEPIPASNVHFIRCGAYVAPSSPFSPAHAFNGLGRVSGVIVEDPEAEDFAGAAIHFHWGANGTGIDNPIVDSYHPNNIRVRNLKVMNCGRPFTLSSCFNVSIVGITGTCDRFGDIIPGDETNFYAVADEQPLVGSSIHVSDFDVDGLINVSSLGALRINSLGTSRADDDVETGEGTRRVLEWQKVVIENGKLYGADDVARGIDLTNAVGDIIIRNVDASGVARSGTGIRIADTRGNILIDHTTVSSALGIDWLRAWGARCTNMNIAMKNRSGLVGDLIGVSVDGSEFSTTLSANKLASVTSISLSAALGAVLNPGDTIIVDGNHVKVSGSRQIRSTETTIPIEAMAWTALSGATVYCDQRSVPKVQGVYSDYDFGVSMSDCKQIDFCKSDFIDIAKQGITGVAKSGLIEINKFIRGGQHRLTDAAYASRNITLSAGAENITVRDNECGIDADYIEMLIQTSADTGNLRIKDNALGNVITTYLSLATQSNTRLDASQFNEYSGNYRKDGGQVTGPSTWYEILQNGIVRYHGTAAPTRGFHRAGSEWVHTTPTVGSPIGGMCTVSGTPGTWVNKANL